ncbi:zinc finger, CCHC-type containing protein [Tanacetum coccineum]|uniref:Zinc finger, CCHC-type containing protein n=1 Tax=Tanacetum coccineum TaxID=301880 RepID=A0ABQ4ZAC2_9ASTR
MHFLLSSMSVVYVLTTPIPEDGENTTVEQIRKRAKWDNDDYVYRGLILNDSDKPKGNNVVGPSVVNIVEHNNSSKYTDNRGKHKYQDTKADPNKKPKVTCWKYGKPGHLKKDCKSGKFGNRDNGSGTNGLVDGSTNSLKVLELIHSDLCDLHDTLSLGNKKYFVTFIVAASRDVIFDKNRFSSVPKPSHRSMINGTEDIGGLVVPEKVTEEDDPKTFDEAMKSQDVAFWKEMINDEMDSIMGNNT